LRRDELREAALAFREREAEHRQEVDGLEKELTDLRKAHARYTHASSTFLINHAP
jgi:uncharacterized coiled-coil DUF342 family protein